MYQRLCRPNNKDTFVVYAVDANLFRLGSTNPKKNWIFFIKNVSIFEQKKIQFFFLKCSNSHERCGIGRIVKFQIFLLARAADGDDLLWKLFVLFINYPPLRTDFICCMCNLFFQWMKPARVNDIIDWINQWKLWSYVFSLMLYL